MSLPPPTQQPPQSLKQVSHYLKVALEHDARDPVISYWARFATVQKSLTIDKSSPEAKLFVISLLEWLEKSKKANAGNEAISVEAAGEAHIENYALKLFSWADESDRSAVFNKNVVKAFYTSGILFDILESLRPPLSDEFTSARKYAKWKAAYIHNCLKNGETPVPGGREEEEDDDDELSNETGGAAASYGFMNPAATTPAGQFGAPAAHDPTPSQFGATPAAYDPNQTANPSGSNNNGSSNPAATGSINNPGYYSTPQETLQQPQASSGATPSLSFDQIAKAQKYCKWAAGALNFDDVATAVENLEKALHLLKTGQEMG